MSPQTVRIKTLTIDGRQVGAAHNETILQVAQENGIWIPTLCYLEGLTPAGACRLCLVEVAGQRRPIPACTTEVYEGMEVTTQSEKLKHYRKVIMELIFSERHHVCAVCVSNHHCELQELAHRLGVDHIRFPHLNKAWKVDASHDRYVQDDNRCVLCGRCVRVCGEIEGAHTMGFDGRGINTCIITDLRQPWGESQTCTRCGKCVHVCPTGALIEQGRSVAEQTKRSQFMPYLTMMREEDKK